MKNPTKKVVVPVEKRLPTKEHRVIVICKTYRCLGYLDHQGIWRDDAKSKELADVTGWMEITA